MFKVFILVFLFSLNSFALDFSREGCAKISGTIISDSCEYVSRDGRIQRFLIIQQNISQVSQAIDTVSTIVPVQSICFDSLDKRNLESIANSSKTTAGIITINFISNIVGSILFVIIASTM